MKELSYRIALAAALAATLMTGQAMAGGRRATANTVPSSGVILGIDRTERTILVAERVGGPTYRIRVPKDTKIATPWSATHGSSVSLELATIGLQYRGIVPR